MNADLNEETVDVTLNKIKAAETSKKIDIIQVFGLKLEQVKELPSTCYPAITMSLPSLLKNQNHLLQHAVLVQLLPYYLPLIPTRHAEHSQHLRLALHQLLPPLLERMHDSKEKIHVPAEKCTTLLGSLCYAATESEHHASERLSTSGSHRGKDRETLAQAFEAKLKELFAAKGAQPKLGAMKVVLGIREEHAAMPLRQYLPLLVDALQDSDGTVREVARSTIVHLLSPPSVPPAARSELRKLMSAKSVKPALGEAIMQQIHDGPQTVATPSEIISGEDGASISKLESENSIAPVTVDTERELQDNFAKLHPWFQGKETEQNWLEREKGINHVRGMLTGGVHKQYMNTFMGVMKAWFIVDSSRVILSLRTTLATATTALYKELAEELGKHLDPVADVMLNALGKMSSLTKKIVAEQSQRAVLAIIKHTSCHARFFLPFLAAGVVEKNVQSRQYYSLYLKTYLEIHAAHDKGHIEAVGLEILVKAVKTAMADINPVVKTHGRSAYWVFAGIWPNEGTEIIDKLDPTVRKQLERARRTSSDAEGAQSQPVPRRAAVSSASEAIRKARLEARGRMRIVSAETPPRELESQQPTRRLSLQPNLAPLPAPEPPVVLPLTEPNLVSAEMSGHLDEITASAATRDPASALAEDPPPRTPQVFRNGNPDASRQPVPEVRQQLSPPRIDKQTIRRTSPSKVQASTPQSVSSLSLPDSPPPQSLGETLLDVDVSYWLDGLTGDRSLTVPAEESDAWLASLRATPPKLEDLQRLTATILEECPSMDTDASTEDVKAMLKQRWQSFLRDEAASRFANGETFVGEAVDTVLNQLNADTETETMQEVLFCLWSLALWHSAVVFGREGSIYDFLFELRKSSDGQVRRSSAALSAVLAETTQDPVYQLNVVVGVLQRSLEPSGLSDKHRERIMVFGLVAAARLIIRLPAAVAEDELKRLQTHIMDAMNSTSIACREAGATIILAVQASVRDESLLFGLLPGLSMAQRNLLTYMFERHTGFRKGPQEKASDAVDLSVNSPGKELLSREMRRLSLKM